MLQVNGMYADAPVGTGTFTRALMEALPEASLWTPAIDPGVERRGNFYRKLLIELRTFSRDRDIGWVHPYTAVGCTSSSTVTVLDLVQYRSSNPPTRFLWRRSIERAGDVIGISHHGCGEVHREFGRSAHLVEPIAAMEFFETERQPPPRGKTVRIAYWGGWHERKGIAWAIEELGRGPLPGPIELTAIGPQPTKETHGRLRLRVVPATTVSELIDIIDASDVVIYPSSEEGYGLPVVEGLLRDRPVVAQALPSYQTFLAHDTPGLLTFDRSQPGSLISAIDRARNVGEGTALSSLAQTDLSAARHRLREQVLAIPSVRRWIELP